MYRFPRILLLAGLLLCGVSAAHSLRAQDPVVTTDPGDGGTVTTDPDDGDDNGGTTDPGDGGTTDPGSTDGGGLLTAVPVFVIYPGYFVFHYTGTITQTTAAGVVTNGTVSLTVRTDGKLTAEIILGDTTTDYTGRLRRGVDKKVVMSGSGYIIPANADGHRIPGATKLPLIVEKGVFRGGSMDEDGTSVVFRGTKDLIQPLTTNGG